MLTVIVRVDLLVQVEAKISIRHAVKGFDVVEVILNKVCFPVRRHILGVRINRFQAADAVAAVESDFQYQLKWIALCLVSLTSIKHALHDFAKTVVATLVVVISLENLKPRTLMTHQIFKRPLVDG